MKIAFQGYNGKMGSAVYKRLIDAKHCIVETFDIDNPFVDALSGEIEVIIDFSTPKSAKRIIDFGIQHGIPVISGTTGFSKQEVESFDREAKKMKVGIYLVPNFLPSISSLYRFLKSFSKNYDKIYIDETHHASKIDAPSGTALFLAKAIPAKKLTGIDARRVNIFMYEHDIILTNKFERVKINHQVLDKNGYAEGVLKALKTVKTFIGVKEHI